jgi:acetyl esterase
LVTLNSDARRLLEKVHRKGAPSLGEASVETARRMFRRMAAATAPAIEPMFAVVSEICPVAGGTIPIRFYLPHGPLERSATQMPLIVFVHGGGWTLGDLEDFDPLCRSLAFHSKCRIASIGYRLAPEHKFPQPLDDVRDALSWLVSESKRLSVDPDLVGIVGDSAGGNLTAVACQLGLPFVPRALALIYPVADLGMTSASHVEFADEFFLTRESLSWFQRQYLPDGFDLSDPRVSPAFGRALAGLRNALIITAGHDPLRDEGRAMADKLKGDGAEVEYKCYEDMIHGFFTMGGSIPGANEAVLQVAAFMRVLIVNDAA